MAGRATVRAAVIGAGVLTAAGVARDLRWHAVHGSAAGAGDVAAGHWLLWLGLVALLLAALLAGRVSHWRLAPGLLLTAAALGAAIEAAHLWAHEAGLDVPLLHTLMFVDKPALVLAVLATALQPIGEHYTSETAPALTPARPRSDAARERRP